MKLTSEMKEVALQVAQQIAPDGWLCGSGPVLDFAERFLAALPKPEPSAALEALEDMDDFARMNCSVEPIGAYSVLKRFIMNATPQDIAALPKPEPVGTFYQCSDGSYRPCPEYYEHAEKLYTAPPPQDTSAIER